MSVLSTSRLLPGTKVNDGKLSYTVVDLLNMTEVLVEDSCGRRDKLAANKLVIDSTNDYRRGGDLFLIDQEDWNDACKIAECLRPLVALGKKNRTKLDVYEVATKLNRHVATVYRWLYLYESTGLVSSLLRKGRSDKGKNRISDKVEKIISECIDSVYLHESRRSVRKTHDEIKKQCKSQNCSIPDINTVRKRILDIDESFRVRRREGVKASEEKFSPIRGAFPGANYPLAVVQIDHTPMDVILVDDTHRQPINRPYLTIAIDVYSKMVVGFYISLDSVGALATGLCISQAILSKERYLHELGIDLEWPCWGVMQTIHTDNAREFRGTMLGRAAREYGIICERRPKGKPQYGGHVERAFRTYMSEVHEELPGTTFSNPKFRKEYDSEGKAVMTLAALEVWFTLFILGVYHQRGHQGNDDFPPIVKWERGLIGGDGVLGRGIPVRFKDEERLRLDFLPYQERTVQEYGVRNEGIEYWSDSLRRLIHAKNPDSIKNKRKYICRYDPRDLQKIWLLDPDADSYIEIPYKNILRPSISIWELRAAKKALRLETSLVTNEELIFKTIEKMRKIVDSESEKTKTARRTKQRMKSWSKVKDKKDKVPDSSFGAIEDQSDDDFSDAQPYENIREG